MKTIKQLVLVCIVGIGVSFQVSCTEKNDEPCKVVEQAKLECEWAVTKACVNLGLWYDEIKDKKSQGAVRELMKAQPENEAAAKQILEANLFSRKELAEEIKHEVCFVFDQWGKAEEKLIQKLGNVSTEKRNELRGSLEFLKEQLIKSVTDGVLPSDEKIPSGPRGKQGNESNSVIKICEIAIPILTSGTIGTTFGIPDIIRVTKDTMEQNRKEEELCKKLCASLDDESGSKQERLFYALMKGVESRVAEWGKINL